MNKPIIEIKDVKKRYRIGRYGSGTLTADLQSWWATIRGKEDPNAMLMGAKRLVGTSFMALNGVSFKVMGGESVGIIGSNGAGKSTLLKLISQITSPTEGEIVLRGRIASMLEVGTGFNGEMTGRENVYMNGAILGMTKAETDEKLQDIIDFSECADFIDTPVKRYSSGMYVKLAFSVAAHLSSEIMIMDEVLAVGDVQFQKKCIEKMSDEATTHGKTILYVSHNMATIRQLCNRCVVLSEGKLIFDGNVEEAIEIYSNDKKGDLVKKDLKAKYKIDHPTKILAVEHIDTDSTSYNAEDKIKLKITWQSSVDIFGQRFFGNINTSGRIIGTAIGPEFDMAKSEHIESILEIDPSFLVQGDYTGDISVGTVRGNVFISNTGHGNAYSFEIIDNKKQDNIVWTCTNFGVGITTIRNVKQTATTTTERI